MTTAEQRWPRYAQFAREMGVGSMMGFLLYTDDQDNLGALDMYATRPGAFGPESEHVGWLVASHAAVAIANARRAQNRQHDLAASHRTDAANDAVRASRTTTPSPTEEPPVFQPPVSRPAAGGWAARISATFTSARQRQWTMGIAIGVAFGISAWLVDSNSPRNPR